MEVHCVEFNSFEANRAPEFGRRTSPRPSERPPLTPLDGNIPVDSSLAAALVALGTRGTSRARREAAAQTSLRILGAWAIPHFHRVFRSALSKLAADERHEIVQNALHEVVITACQSGFRGDNERAAHAWARTVMRLRILVALRDRPRIPIDYSANVESALQAAATDAEDDRETVERFLATIEDEALRQRRPKDRESLLSSIRLYVRSRLGADEDGRIDSQGELENPENATDLERKRTRDLVYQRRRRGKIVVQRALEMLRASSAWDPSYAFAARALGLNVPRGELPGLSEK